MENGQNKEEQNQIESYNTEANQEAWISQGEETLYKTYNRFPVVFERGEGLHLYDTDGKEYLDFFAGIAVNALGYGDEEYTEYIRNRQESFCIFLIIFIIRRQLRLEKSF